MTEADAVWECVEGPLWVQGELYFGYDNHIRNMRIGIFITLPDDPAIDPCVIAVSMNNSPTLPAELIVESLKADALRRLAAMLEGK